jgi:lambda family phage portal protein
MKMLGGYEDAAITAARSAAVKSAAYVATPDFNPDVSPAGAETFEQNLNPGAIEVVPPGWDLKPLDWGWPNTEHGDFVQGALRGIASGLGISYNALANDLTSVNFSSLRQGALTERDLWMMLQAWYIDWVSRPIYRRWLSFAVLTGRITRNNGAPIPIERLTAIQNATYQARRWPWVDPLKDIQSNRESVELRSKSISQVIRETGADPEEVWSELAEDMQALEKMGIPVTQINPLNSAPIQETGDE